MLPVDSDPLLYAAGAALYAFVGFGLVRLSLSRRPDQAARASPGARILVAMTWPLVLAILVFLGVVRALNRS